jgi:chemotaxis protein MotA
MDLATILGLVLGLVIVGVVMIMDGGSPADLFAHPSAILLTMGGAVMVTMVSYPLKTTLGLPQMFLKAIMGNPPDPVPAIELIAEMAERARREGLLALEETTGDIEDPFLRKGVMLVVDGIDPAQVKSVLQTEVRQMQERHEQKYSFLNTAGGYGPTLGIIGTVMGLVNILKELDKPATLGASIAAAFLATLWGILSANMIWLPVGGKLRSKSDAEAQYRNMLTEGILALQAGENPRMVKEKLLAYLPPKQRAALSEYGGDGQAARQASAEA